MSAGVAVLWPPTPGTHAGPTTTRIEIEVPAYRPAVRLRLEWDAGFEITVRGDGDQVAIRANAAGLRPLARRLLALAAGGVPAGAHVHLDDSSSLEEYSLDLILERA